MEEIEYKLKELWEMLRTPPEDCKGPDNSENRKRWLKIKCNIHELIVND